MNNEYDYNILIGHQVIITIPEVPAFSGDIKEASAIQTIMGAQWRTINRGGDSIMETIRAAGYNP
jgi:phospholipase D1/2